MSHPYEYSMMVRYLTPVLDPGVPDLGKQPNQMKLVKELGRFASQLHDTINSAPGGDDWQVNSHSLMLHGKTIVITLLLRRPRRQ